MNKINLKAKALDFLSRRDYTYIELYRKLQKYSDDVEEIKSILDSFIDCNYINEERFIENFIHSKSKKYGSLKIKHLLQDKINNKKLINEIYNQSTINELELATTQLKRKYSIAPQDTKEKAKYFRFLIGRGFSSSIAIKAIEKAFIATDIEY